MKITKVFYRLFDDERAQRDRIYLPITLILSFLWRLPLLISPEVIRNDGTEYIRIAKFMLKGIWSEGEIPPFYSSLIVAANFLTRDFELAGILVSVVLGTLTVIPVYYLGKRLYSARTGFVAGLLIAFQPYLYKYSGSVLTESTYTLLITTAVLFGWMAFSTGKLRYTPLFSLFAALAYLTRPEAIGFVLVFCVWSLIVSPVEKKQSIGKRVLISGVTLLLFVVFSSPYLLYLRQETGRWAISKKVTVSVGERSETTYATTTERKVPRQKPRDVYFTTMLKDPLNLGKRMLVGLGDSFNKFQQVFTPYLFILAIIGFLRRIHGVHPWKGNIYIVSYHIFFFGCVLPFFFITQRYTVPLIPIALPWAAIGLEGFTAWLHDTVASRHDTRKWYLASICITLLVLCTHGIIANDSDHRLGQREAGLWMRNNLTQKGSVMAISVHESFYADLPWVWHNKKGYAEILEYAKAKGVRYLIIDTEDEPSFEEDLRKSPKKELKPVLEKKYNGGKILVFEVLPD